MRLEVNLGNGSREQRVAAWKAQPSSVKAAFRLIGQCRARGIYTNANIDKFNVVRLNTDTRSIYIYPDGTMIQDIVASDPKWSTAYLNRNFARMASWVHWIIHDLKSPREGRDWLPHLHAARIAAS